jgi:hypothetical protein
MHRFWVSNGYGAEPRWPRITGRFVRSRSKAEFVARRGADEAILSLELLTESGIVSQGKTRDLLAEARELTVIFTASQQTARNAA